MKICSQCQELLPLNQFDQQSTGKQGCRADCKECRKRFYRSKPGLVKQMYGIQKSKSKKRGYQPPSYTEKELGNWLDKQPVFHGLYEAWENSGYQTDLRPSVDRLHDYVSYTLDNIQVMSWADHSAKSYKDQIVGNNNKKSIAVDMLTLEGEFIRRFHSMNEAARHFNGIAANIAGVIQGRVSRKLKPDGTYRTWIPTAAYGYKWRYSIVPNDNKELQNEDVYRLGVSIN